MGGRHLAAGGLFVEHRGGTSFGSAEKQRLVAQNNAVISRRHPGFDAEVQGFLQADPLVTPRLALGIAFAAMRVRGRHCRSIWRTAWAAGPRTTFAHGSRATCRRLARARRSSCGSGGALRWQVELHLPEAYAARRHRRIRLRAAPAPPLPGARYRLFLRRGRSPIRPSLPARLLALKRGPRRPDRGPVPRLPSRQPLLHADRCRRPPSRPARPA